MKEPKGGFIGRFITWKLTGKNDKPNGVVVQIVKATPNGPIVGVYVALQGVVNVERSVKS